MKTKFFLILLAIAVLNSSCATLLTGTKEKIYFHTEPVGAKVVINGVNEGVTPAEIKVKRKVSETKVTFKKDGYKDEVIKLEKKLNLVYYLNIFGIVGFGIDALSGAMYKYDKVYYEVELEKNKNTNPQ